MSAMEKMKARVDDYNKKRLVLEKEVKEINNQIKSKDLKLNYHKEKDIEITQQGDKLINLALKVSDSTK